MQMFEKFYDFKISSDKFAYVHANREADIYCKLVSKRILLLIEVPNEESVEE